MTAKDAYQEIRRDASERRFLNSAPRGPCQDWRPSIRRWSAVPVTRYTLPSVTTSKMVASVGTGICACFCVSACGQAVQVTRQGGYFVNTTARQQALEFFDFATGRVEHLARLEREPQPFEPGLAISPDGRTILYVQRDQRNSDIVLVENFR